MKFKATRLKALDLWLSHTGRETGGDTGFDGYTSAHECDWQDKAYDNGFNHISFFCSFGTFNSHITELLTDTRFDDLEIDSADTDVTEIIFRFYERVLLVTSQTLEDFEYMIGCIRGIKKSKQKRKTLGAEVENAFAFINNVNKHKKNHFHSCNNHIGFVFEDADPKYASSTALSWGNPISDYKVVYVPKLEKVIGCLLSCYDLIKTEFNDKQKFSKFCKKFEEK